MDGCLKVVITLLSLNIATVILAIYLQVRTIRMERLLKSSRLQNIMNDKEDDGDASEA